jgi:hypothetical protein
MNVDEIGTGTPLDHLWVCLQEVASVARAHVPLPSSDAESTVSM